MAYPDPLAPVIDPPAPPPVIDPPRPPAPPETPEKGQGDDDEPGAPWPPVMPP